jgi:hypothetical protein
MRKLSRKQKIAASTAVIVGIAGGGAAYAFWTSTGHGTGSASTGTSAAVDITQTNTISGLVPGGPAQNIALTVSNTSPTQVSVNAITPSIKSITNQDGTPATGCSSADFAFTPSAATSVPANGTASPTGATIALVNDTTRNQDGCKNVSVALNLDAA